MAAGQGIRGDKDTPSKKWVVFIDVLRGYAILMMLQGHMVGVVLADQYRDTDHWFYATLYYLRGLTAPCFFLASGIIFSYLLLKNESTGTPYVRKGVLRGLWLIGVGFLLQWKPVHLTSLNREDWTHAFAFLDGTHVLHTVGASLILIATLRHLVQGRRFYYLSGGLALAMFLLGHYFHLQPPGWGALHWAEIFLVKPYAFFPLLPWCGFALLGAVLGALGWEYSWFHSPRAMGKVALAGMAIALIGGGMHHMTDTLPFLKVASASFYRAGEVIAFAALIALICYHLQRRGQEHCLPLQVIRKVGTETLVIYVLHAIILYGCITDWSLKNYLSRELGPFATFVMVVLFWAFFIWLAFALPRWRQKVRWLRFFK